MGDLVEFAKKVCYGCPARDAIIQLAREIELLWEKVRQLERRDE